MEKTRTGFTKTGFSKSNLACCSRFVFCQMGKGICYYAESDPEVQEYCAAYQRHHGGGKQPTEYTCNVQVAKETVEKVVETTDTSCKELETGQLSLF